MKDIKRYNLDAEAFKGSDRIKFNLTEDEKYGVYVKYLDHKEIVDCLNKKIEEMKNCGNCDNDATRDYEMDHLCIYSHTCFRTAYSDKSQDNWQLKENKTE